jgi:hypothetical protein
MHMLPIMHYYDKEELVFVLVPVINIFLFVSL